MRASQAGAVAAAAMLVGAGLVWTFTDPDADGLTSIQEMRLGTDPTVNDSDHDGLPDGWELSHGLDPRRSDMDLDGLPDGADLRAGGDPRAADSDHDGIPDAEEVGVHDSDCNHNGVHAIGDSDDDSDQRPDGNETPAHRCNPDVDHDHVLDGQEGAEVCVERPDCDADGLNDSEEYNSSFDPLNPDTFHARLPDSILWAFREHGQAPSADQDGDGIPDAWENESGLIDWGPFHPQPGRRDLMMEVLRVEGPDSSRADGLDVGPAFTAMQTAFQEQGGVTFSWTTTDVRLDSEPRPPNLPSSLSSYYSDLLNRSRFADNPYVSTIVLNPQHDQTQVVHLGVAPIRGMLAAIDYGAHTDFEFKGQRVDRAGTRTTITNLTLSLSPLVESLIVANRQDAVQAMGFESGTRLADGRFELRGSNYRLEWTPFWFRTAPLVLFDDGASVQLHMDSMTLDTTVLANTIFHELGHTLGLCHLELPDCLALLPADEQGLRESSSMFTNHDPHTIRFLPGEWDRVHEFLSCPPTRPIALVAENATAAKIISAKYAYALGDVLNVTVRSCGDFRPIAREFAPVPNATHYVVPADERNPPRGDPTRWAFVVETLSVAMLAASAAFVPAALRRR